MQSSNSFKDIVELAIDSYIKCSTRIFPCPSILALTGEIRHLFPAIQPG